MTKREQEQQRIIGNLKTQVKDLKKSCKNIRNGRTYAEEIREVLENELERRTDKEKQKTFTVLLVLLGSNVLWLLTCIL